MHKTLADMIFQIYIALKIEKKYFNQIHISLI